MMSIRVTGLKELQDNLKRLQQGIERNKSFKVEIKSDENGYIERQCPNRECEKKFKVHFEDWISKMQVSHKAYCPHCNFEASETQWYTAEQLESMHSQVVGQISKVISSLGRYYGSTSFSVNASELLITSTTCMTCGCRYQYIGTSFYCPACGMKKLNFREQYERISKIADSLEQITGTLDPDTRQNVRQTLLESSLKEIVEVFQANCELLYTQVTSGAVIPKNAFQNLEKGSDMWERTRLTIKYSDLLSQQEYSDLTEAFQKRHLLVHKQGEVDDDYLKNTNNNTHRKGMRITISETTVASGVVLANKLLQKLFELIEENK